MSNLIRYHVDATNLSPEERERIYNSLERTCFITNIDLVNIGCYETFLEERYDLRTLAHLPDGCTITRL